MPKMKTKKSVSKHFAARPGGTIKRSQAFKHHILTRKTIKNERYLCGTKGVHGMSLKSARAMMPYA